MVEGISSESEESYSVLLLTLLVAFAVVEDGFVVPEEDEEEEVDEAEVGSRIRNECTSEPESNIAESGKDENALWGESSSSS